MRLSFLILFALFIRTFFPDNFLVSLDRTESQALEGTCHVFGCLVPANTLAMYEKFLASGIPPL